jgi:hypothetical protein
MADLIDRAALLKIIRAEAVNAMELTADRHHPSALAFGHCHSLVKRAPAVDAVEVVRCKDCECWNEEDKGGRATLGTLVCACDNWSNQEDGYSRYTRPDDFCSCGERRTDGKTN